MSPRTLAENVDASVGAVYVDPYDAYLLAPGRNVLRVPRSGGAAEPLSVVCRGGNVVGDATHVYVIDVAGQCISRCAKAPGAKAELLDSEIELSGKAYDGGAHVYFTTNDAIARIAKAGGEAELVLEVEEPELVAIDDANVYFVAGSFFGPSVRAFVLPKAGGDAREVDIGPALPGTVRFAAGAFHVLDAAGTLTAFDPKSGVARAVRTVPVARRPFLHMNASYVYVGDVGRAPLEGGPLETIEVEGVIQTTIDERGITWLARTPRGVTLQTWD